MVSSVLSSEAIHQVDYEFEDDSDTDEEEREQLRRREIKKCFDVVDSDSSGFIDKKEFGKILNRLGKDLRKEEVDECFRKIDRDLSGRIEFSEFYKWYRSVQN